MKSINGTCRWVRRRLPLLAGGDLAGLERRRVERHLLGCPTCRANQEAVARSHGILQDFAALGPIGAGTEAGAAAPSLWPALARQIRESKHQPAFGSLTDRVWSWRLAPGAVWAGSGLAATLLFLALGSIWGATSARVPAPSPLAAIQPAESATPEVPIGPNSNPPLLMADSEQLRRFFAEYDQLFQRFNRRRSALPAGTAVEDTVVAKPGVDPFAPPIDFRLNYDLDVGRLLGPTADTQRAY